MGSNIHWINLYRSKDSAIGFPVDSATTRAVTCYCFYSDDLVLGHSSLVSLPNCSLEET